MKNPYGSQQRNSLDNAPPQKAEAFALVEMARRINHAIETERPQEETKDILRLNWKIWTIIQTELLDENNSLPQEIRQNLLNLSNFIDKRTIDILTDFSYEKIKVLVNINRNIGAGLMGNPGDSLEGTQTSNTDEAQPSPDQL